LRIDPWSSQQSTDYARLRDEFGIEEFNYAQRLEAATGQPASRLIRRGVIFGHRGFEPVMRAIEDDQPWGVLTGLMPSGPMHLGHKMVMDQVMYYQSLGADVTICVADIEAYATRGMSLEKAREIAMEEYISTYFALGLKPERLQVYFQSDRQAVKDMAWQLAPKVNWSAMESIYGFGGDTNMGKVISPLVQVGDILHVQLPKYGGPRPIVVPVGVDQDPHVRLTRDIAQGFRLFNVQWHKDQKLGDVLGIFVKGVEDPKVAEKHLKAAEKYLTKILGFGDFVMNAAYGALYIPAARPKDVVSVDVALAKLEPKLGDHFGFIAPASTYHRFMQGLTGGKMSSSKPETHISLRDDAKSAAKKVAGALTGGRTTAEEQRRLGAETDKCMVYELYVYHLIEDDAELTDTYTKSSTGAMLCGECKNGIAKPRIEALINKINDGRPAGRALAEKVVEASRQ